MHSSGSFNFSGLVKSDKNNTFTGLNVTIEATYGSI